MSWRNPTKKEAEESYGNAKSKYRNAAESYIHNKKELESLQSERNKQILKGSSSTLKKISFEKRIKQIEEIIHMLSPGGAVDDAISAANNAARKDEE